MRGIPQQLGGYGLLHAQMNRGASREIGGHRQVGLHGFGKCLRVTGFKHAANFHMRQFRIIDDHLLPRVAIQAVYRLS